MILIVYISSIQSKFKARFSHSCQKVGFHDPVFPVVANMWEQIPVEHITNSPGLILLCLPCGNDTSDLFKRIFLRKYPDVYSLFEVFFHKFLDLGIVRNRFYEVFVFFKPKCANERDKIDAPGK